MSTVDDSEGDAVLGRGCGVKGIGGRSEGRRFSRDVGYVEGSIDVSTSEDGAESNEGRVRCLKDGFRLTRL